MRKGGICVLLSVLVMSPIAIPVTAIVSKTAWSPQMVGNILYVGGSGPGNYSKIQDAIDDAAVGDTVFLYSYSSPYQENIVINTSLILTGENKETAIIQGMEITPTVALFADGITLQHLTLRHSDELEEEPMDILFLCSNNNTVKNIILTGKAFRKETGIMLKNSSRNVLSNNRIEHIYDTGIELRNSHENMISGNTITGVIWTRGFGICVIDSSNNVIKRNEICSLSCCVNLNELYQQVVNNQIIQNNFMKYYLRMSGVYFQYDYYRFPGVRGNMFEENYWNRPRLLPKYILGWIRLFWIPLDGYKYQFHIPLPKYDRHPAKEPYDIPEIR